MGTPLVIVESPAKARTIEKYLGGDFKVEASVGHIRDLPGRASEIPARYKKEKWARLGVDVDADFKPLYVVPADKKPQVKKLKELLKNADELYLATDEDREGESISWHLYEVLKPKVPVRRLVFHEITREAIQRALQQPRDIDQDLVRAQEARRIVDRLYGYEVSPLLWKKIRPKLSAGRVQSVAVRLIVERERERMAFQPATWWDASGRFAGPQGALDADLDRVGGQRIARGRDFGQDGRLKRKGVRVLDQQTAEALAAGLVGQPARVISVEKKPTTDKPAPPFTTSTLQQEANRKLNWTARRTMSVAQHLYETGWITYMRTDSTTLSQEAIRAARDLIREQYGPEYLPSKPRIYKGKVKNAQEAHEAIRPAGSRFRTIAEAARELGADERRLYELIWKRTVASQMENARGFSTAVRIEVGEGELASVFEARGKTIAFPGYRRAYVEGADDPDEALADQERILPPLKEGDVLSTEAVTPREHTTKPPARLTEASLVKELERRGIGRPSTYASIIDTILRREYVFKKGSALVPTFTAFAVVRLLEEYLGWLVDYDFTARMEDRLDEIAIGQADALSYLRAFYQGAEGLHVRLEEAAERIDPREVCTVTLGQDDDGNPIVVRIGRYGPYLERGEDRADVPDDIPPDELTVERAVELLSRKKDGPIELGVDPESGRMVYLMHGRFGPYVQLGEADGDGRPKRASLLRGMTPQDLDLDLALKLLSLPRSLGTDPDTGEEVIAANGRYGPYVKRGRTSRTIPAHLNVLEITLDEARTLLATAKARRGPEPLKDLGEDPSTGRAIKLMSGRYGPYVTDGETNASLPKDMDPLSIELDRAIELIRVREQAPKRPRRTTRRTTAKKTATKKTASKKTTAKKTTAKKTTAKKTATKKTTAKKTATKKTTSK
ncbi:MAG: type I DNA topoisomerase, partial [Deltaproteobacteria bacterium]